MICRATLSGLILLLAAALHPACAGNTADGLRLARTLCTNCHIVEPGGASREVVAGVPSFMAVANKEAQTADKIGTYILNPHPPMPQVQLTTAELADIAAYIMSLKTR
jgi:mono/diheme cytochrome c family protein